MVRFLTLNVNGLRDVNKRMSLLQWLSHSSTDFVCLQGVHATSCAEASSWFAPYGFLVVSAPGNPHSGGSVILYRSNVVLSNSWVSANGRFLMAEFVLRKVRFRVACIYAPNRNPERNDFLANCASRVDPSVPTLVCGDFNCVFDRSRDRRGSDVCDVSRESHLALQGFFDAGCMVDIWRYLNPSSSSFTWMRADGLLASRIDIIGCPFLCLHCVTSCSILPCPYSDHSAVVIVSSVSEPFPRGPGKWKLNISILRDSAFIKSVEEFWAS